MAIIVPVEIDEESDGYKRSRPYCVTIDDILWLDAKGGLRTFSNQGVAVGAAIAEVNRRRGLEDAKSPPSEPEA